MSEGNVYAMGCWRDLPDLRDFNPETPEIAKLLKQLGPQKVKGAVGIPLAIDLRQWCSPIENQQNIGSCTAHAGVGLIEYFEKRCFGKYLDASRMFLYKVTRDLLHWTGDTGAFLRTTMKSMVMFGVCLEEYWPYNTPQFDVEPSAFCYAMAQDYQTLQYFRYDTPGKPRPQVLTDVKVYLAHGVPAMFGFTCYPSIFAVGPDGNIPYPQPNEHVAGGHAIDVVGYDDNRHIGNHTGAFLIRNSWGTGWGDHGYGWLPYDYLLNGLANDFWATLSQEWLDTGVFN